MLYFINIFVIILTFQSHGTIAFLNEEPNEYNHQAQEDNSQGHSSTHTNSLIYMHTLSNGEPPYYLVSWFVRKHELNVLPNIRQSLAIEWKYDGL